MGVCPKMLTAYCCGCRAWLLDEHTDPEPREAVGDMNDCLGCGLTEVEREMTTGAHVPRAAPTSEACRGSHAL